MAKESRVVQLQTDLLNMGYIDSLKALNWMISIMNSGNGYKRHDGRHYYYHLVDVTQDLINHGITDEVTITACILHDAIEDVPYITYETVKSLFGQEVADVVQGVTKNPDINYKEDREAFKEYLKVILNNWRMLLVKTVDRKNNMGTLKDASPEKELRQALETEEYFLPLFKEGRKRYPEFARFFHSAKTSLMPHIIKIKQHHKQMEQIKELLENSKLVYTVGGNETMAKEYDILLYHIDLISRGLKND
ncbi:SpoT-like bifunctional (p)ppGpp synthase/hydrolase [Bacillus phage Izhevsk]|uniref:SpoT-like bifunctional (P)ppGpp synthase/hydrolase n=1 Tax=Bacillus phage Izhevsk TaxID=2724322 RepID=A0A6H0X656_9CAUD|nr:SpoT-like bifunctional (p)ppGpp synthase/hydrolase [Bacillus phage Izhevsk]QIW89776.1 SpoT-like bifunctional (p)ppGpp synthase/hydrolase [Bacillus phage Izhevsk]